MNRKLFNILNEGLDFDDIDITVDDMMPLGIAKKKAVVKTEFDRFADKFLRLAATEPLDDVDKDLIKSINENPANWQGTVRVDSLQDLKRLINRAILYFGNDGNYNWIDVSNITSFTSLFAGRADFNGDITLWDTHNVVNMTYTFQGAKSFNRDLSNWDYSKVKFMTGCYKQANPLFVAHVKTYYKLKTPKGALLLNAI